MQTYYVYILTNKTHSVLYTGVTRDLQKRIQEHKEEAHAKSFTSRYKVTKLVWYAYFHDIETAIQYEKRIKRWRRQWKINLIEKENPRWEDLSL